jgi:signal transduction histidine kinase
VLDETIGMQHLVDDLLLLAQSDGEGLGSPDHSVRVDLDDIVFAEADRLRAVGRRVIDVSAVGAAQVIGDPHRLRRAIANLADNAERQATSTVRLRLHEADGRAELAVEDDGLGVPIGADELIFERFGRADEARSGGVGAGLGLAIARDIVVRSGGTLDLDRHHRPGARFVVSLPLAQ